MPCKGQSVVPHGRERTRLSELSMPRRRKVKKAKAAQHCPGSKPWCGNKTRRARLGYIGGTLLLCLPAQFRDTCIRVRTPLNFSCVTRVTCIHLRVRVLGAGSVLYACFQAQPKVDFEIHLRLSLPQPPHAQLTHCFGDCSTLDPTREPVGFSNALLSSSIQPCCSHEQIPVHNFR